MRMGPDAAETRTLDGPVVAMASFPWPAHRGSTWLSGDDTGHGCVIHPLDPSPRYCARDSGSPRSPHQIRLAGHPSAMS